jgi:hypothetical protein
MPSSSLAQTFASILVRPKAGDTASPEVISQYPTYASRTHRV